MLLRDEAMGTSCLLQLSALYRLEILRPQLVSGEKVFLFMFLFFYS